MFSPQEVGRINSVDNFIYSTDVSPNFLESVMAGLQNQGESPPGHFCLVRILSRKHSFN